MKGFGPRAKILKSLEKSAQKPQNKREKTLFTSVKANLYTLTRRPASADEEGRPAGEPAWRGLSMPIRECKQDLRRW